MAPLGSPPDGRSPTLFGYRIWRTVCQMHDFPEVMEDQLTTPFLRAIITRSKDDMLRMLLEDSELEDRLREEFRAGQIAVAAADLIMLWFPLGAAALMDLHHRTEAGRAPVGLLHTVAASAELPLLWSLVNGFNCSRRAGRSTKGYLDAISTLLQLDCAVPNALLSFIQWELLHTPIHIASKVYDTDLAKLLTLCASHLANRRQRLTRTARKYLGQQELQVLGLLGFAPAIHMLEGMDAAKAWQMLLSKGLNTPTALDPCLGDRFNEAEDKEWVYGGCDASGTAELLFEAGHTPDKMVLAWIETRSSIPLRSSAFVAWLLVRCADKTLVSPVPTNFAIPGKRNVHLLSAELVMPDQEEREEIQEEDGLRLNILERLQEDMKLKWLSSQNHQLTLEGFVRDEWWPTLAQSLQQIEADAETLEEAICGMESVGVKAGPVPFLEEGTWVLSDAIASDVSSIASDVDEDEREQWEQNAVLAEREMEA
ncbi:hypothetical protein LIA77_08659 [Sarocladium implicatum]|nr:hypothetical protein LIA77_08659 [Sarocladium implicatum]